MGKKLSRLLLAVPRMVCSRPPVDLGGSGGIRGAGCASLLRLGTYGSREGPERGDEDMRKSPPECGLSLTRAGFLTSGTWAAAALAFGWSGQPSDAAEQLVQTRAIPSSGERLPVIGCGTLQTFDVGSSSDERSLLPEVLRTLFGSARSGVDSSPMY